jgi:hypothetical protein
MRPTRLLENHESKDLNRSNHSNWLASAFCAVKTRGCTSHRAWKCEHSLIPETRPWYIKRPDVQIIMLTENVIMIALVAGDTRIRKIAGIGIINNAQSVGA